MCRPECARVSRLGPDVSSLTGEVKWKRTLGSSHLKLRVYARKEVYETTLLLWFTTEYVFSAVPVRVSKMKQHLNEWFPSTLPVDSLNLYSSSGIETTAVFLFRTKFKSQRNEQPSPVLAASQHRGWGLSPWLQAPATLPPHWGVCESLALPGPSCALCHCARQAVSVCPPPEGPCIPHPGMCPLRGSGPSWAVPVPRPPCRAWRNERVCLCCRLETQPLGPRLAFKRSGRRSGSRSCHHGQRLSLPGASQRCCFAPVAEVQLGVRWIAREPQRQGHLGAGCRRDL